MSDEKQILKVITMGFMVYMLSLFGNNVIGDMHFIPGTIIFIGAIIFCIFLLGYIFD